VRLRGTAFGILVEMKASKISVAKLPEAKAGYIEPMLCDPVKTVPEGPEWIFEIKLDGFRIIAAKPVGEGVTLWSRRGNNLNRKFFYIADALDFLPEGTVLDGELVALDGSGRPKFDLLESFRSQAENVRYYAFDVLRLRGHDVTGLSLLKRKALLDELVRRKSEKILISEFVMGSAKDMLREVKTRGLEGVVCKRGDSLYEPGERSGAWVKHRVNLGQEFVVGGYVPGKDGFESLVIGYYRGRELLYVHRLVAGFTKALRQEIFAGLKGFEVEKCPFVNLPQEGKSRWGGEGLNAEKMKHCVWLKPEKVVQVEFLEWTSDTHLRHAKFVGMREDKRARDVVKET
jgi:DNA ligase D-like protein (predicted ligase)